MEYLTTQSFSYLKVYEDVFIWSNGDEVNVTNWSADGEPTTSGYTDVACTLLTPNKGWKVSSCHGNGEHILPLCEKAVVSGKIF